MRRALMFGLLGITLGAGMIGAAQEPAQPTFRVGATYVRVDAFVTKNGEPVTDLTKDDFEIREDNVPQTVRTFEYVNIPPAVLQPGERRDPNTVQEMRNMAGEPRRRVFVLFLDSYHVTTGAGMSSRNALLKFLQRVIGPDDLIAGMTPEMAPESISFSPRTGTLEDALRGFWGRRDALQQDEEETRMEGCFSREDWQVFRERRRAKLSLDALEGLVYHLDGLRDERKAIITITEGWPVFRDDIRLAQNPNSAGTGPMVVSGRGGRLGTSDPTLGGSLTPGECDAVRMQLANINTWQQFRDLPDIANRVNASFYTVDPRGLAVFDTPIDAPVLPPPNVDQAILRDKLSNLRELAERTDGLAVQNTNDLTGALNKVARDLSAYYLVGYDSTNPKLDGSYRTIKLQIKRPGVVVRARKGYRAAIDATRTSNNGRGGRSSGGATPGGSGTGNGNGGGAGAGANAAGGSGKGTGTGANGAGAGSSAGGAAAKDAAGSPGAANGATAAADNPNADVVNAVAGLTATRADLPIRLRVASVRVKADSGDVHELRVIAELDTKTAASPFWQQGGTARIVVRNDTESIASTDATLPLGERTLLVTVPLPANVKPGDYRVQVRMTTASKTDSVGDTVTAIVPANATNIGEPAVLRRGPSTGLAYVPTADLRFRRQERLRLETPIVIPLSRVKAIIVDQRGQTMPLPVHVTEKGEGAAHVAVVDVSLAPLAPGGYAVIVTDAEDAKSPRVLVPVQVIP
jgi:VWFA-related protein